MNSKTSANLSRSVSLRYKTVEPKVATRSSSLRVPDASLVSQFREARRAREEERLLKIREKRMQSGAPSTSRIVPCQVQRSSSNRLLKGQGPVSKENAMSTVPPNLKKAPAAVKALGKTLNGEASKPKVGVSDQVTASKVTTADAQVRVQENNAPTLKSTFAPVQERGSAAQKLTRNKKPLTPSRLLSKVSAKSKGKPTQRATVKQTKTTQLRLLRANPILQMIEAGLLPPDTKLLAGRPQDCVKPTQQVQNLEQQQSVQIAAQNSSSTYEKKKTKKIQFVSKTPTTPSRIPVKKTSFASPAPRTPKRTPTQTPARTPKPGFLREKLTEWLEQHGHSLAGFKHLSCFGIHGSAVKRPQTPFRRILQSASKLKAIPESAESTPTRVENQDDDLVSPDSVLNTTYTMDDEDKENLPSDQQEGLLSEGKLDDCQEIEESKKLDEAFGVLSELHNLIKMGYPSDQCELWVRAIRRRFPQCGDEAVYWECLASLEVANGDLQSAVECFERAMLQGAEESVQKSIDDIRQKLSALNVDCPSSSTHNNIPETPTRNREGSLLDSSNIIRSSSIQFAVQDKSQCSVKKRLDTTAEFVATPVRRSARRTASPFHNSQTSGLTCVPSLDSLKPEVRKSLVFHSNAALKLRE